MRELKTSPRNIQPRRDGIQPPCPFYGFSQERHRELFGRNNNQCALEIAQPAPCQMESRGESPDWKKCPMAEKVSENLFINHMVVANGHSGPIPFRKWRDSIAQIQAVQS